MKLSPAPLMTLANSVERQSERRFNPDRFNGPANFHEVRACVSADAAQAINNQVAFLARSLSAALMGKPQFQIEVTALPAGPLGQRANPIFPTTFDFSGLLITAAEEWASR